VDIERDINELNSTEDIQDTENGLRILAHIIAKKILRDRKQTTNNDKSIEEPAVMKQE
jgi:integrase/recombinase XerD